MKVTRGIALVALATVLLAVTIPNVSATPPPGDVNDDGSVNTVDATLILQFDAGIITALVAPFGADVNYDDLINSLDALLILQVEAGLIPISDLILPPRIILTLASGTAGEQVTVQLEALDFIYYYLLRWSIDVPYDSQVVELQSCTPGTGSTCTPLPETSAVRVSGNDEHGLLGLLGNVVLATIDFRCSAPGTARLEPDVIELKEGVPEVEAGTITCTSPS